MRFLKGFALFCAGGLGYGLLEIAWRGQTHISMFFVGGLCFFIIGGLDEFHAKPCLLLQAVVSSAAVTAVEFMSGVYINLILGLRVWDYSDMPLNLMGQICLPFSTLWLIVSVPAIYFEDFLRHCLFNEPLKHQRILPYFKRAVE